MCHSLAVKLVTICSSPHWFYMCVFVCIPACLRSVCWYFPSFGTPHYHQYTQRYHSLQFDETKRSLYFQHFFMCLPSFWHYHLFKKMFKTSLSNIFLSTLPRLFIEYVYNKFILIPLTYVTTRADRIDPPSITHCIRVM